MTGRMPKDENEDFTKSSRREVAHLLLLFADILLTLPETMGISRREWKLILERTIDRCPKDLHERDRPLDPRGDRQE